MMAVLHEQTFFLLVLLTAPPVALMAALPVAARLTPHPDAVPNTHPPGDVPAR